LPKPKTSKDRSAKKQFELSKKEAREVASESRFIISCVQNNTGMEKALETVKRYSDYNDSRIILIPARYRNPTSQIEHEKGQDKIWWPKDALPYMIESEVPLHKNLKLMAHARVQATAVNPLTGFAPLTQGSSAIFGHAQVAMQTVPTPQNSLPGILHTTGSLSRRNYSKTKAGIKAEFHHSLGVCIVEKKGKYFHLRHACIDRDGGFFDFTSYYSPKGITHDHRLPGIVTGDEHAIWMAEHARKGIYGSNGIVDQCKPEVIVRHDVLDSYSCSHHHKHLEKVAKHEWKLHRVLDELQATKDHIDSTTPDGSQNILVASNHNDHLLRWLNEVDIKKEPWNAALYHHLSSLVIDAIEMTDGGAEMPDPFALWASPQMQSDCIFPHRSEHLTIKGILVTLHGDVGPHGSRGSRRNLADLGIRVIIGHAHAPGICRGCYQVGTSTGDLSYTRGPDGWMVTLALISPNGKRQLVNVMKDASFRG
jgi:hypothetical protein